VFANRLGRVDLIHLLGNNGPAGGFSALSGAATAGIAMGSDNHTAFGLGPGVATGVFGDSTTGVGMLSTLVSSNTTNVAMGTDNAVLINSGIGVEAFGMNANSNNPIDDDTTIIPNSAAGAGLLVNSSGNFPASLGTASVPLLDAAIGVGALGVFTNSSRQVNAGNDDAILRTNITSGVVALGLADSAGNNTL
jgi:hypothetical protein